MTTANSPFISLDLLHEARGILREQIQIGVDAIERTPVRQRDADDRLLLAKGRHDVGIYDTLAAYWDAGIFPSPIDDAWQMASLSKPGTVHHIWRDARAHAGWRCDCWQAEGGFHVHQAAMIAIELALDLAERAHVRVAAPVAAHPDYEPAAEYDDDPFLPSHTARVVEPPSATALGARLARARRSLLEAA